MNESKPTHILMIFRLPKDQDCHELWSKMRKRRLKEQQNTGLKLDEQYPAAPPRGHRVAQLASAQGGRQQTPERKVARTVSDENSGVTREKSREGQSKSTLHKSLSENNSTSRRSKLSNKRSSSNIHHHSSSKSNNESKNSKRSHDNGATNNVVEANPEKQVIHEHVTKIFDQLHRTGSQGLTLEQLASSLNVPINDTTKQLLENLNDQFSNVSSKPKKDS